MLLRSGLRSLFERSLREENEQQDEKEDIRILFCENLRVKVDLVHRKRTPIYNSTATSLAKWRRVSNDREIRWESEITNFAGTVPVLCAVDYRLRCIDSWVLSFMHRPGRAFEDTSSIDCPVRIPSRAKRISSIPFEIRIVDAPIRLFVTQL